MSVSLNRSTVTGTPSRSRISGPGTAPLYPMVLMVWSFAISTSTGPMRRVTSAGPSGSERLQPAVRRPVPIAVFEKKSRRVTGRLFLPGL